MTTAASGYSFYSIPGDGATDTFPLQFALGVLKLAYVLVYVDGEVDGEGAQVYRQIESVPGDSGMIKVLGDVVPSGVNINFQRVVPKDLLIHLYANGSVLDYPSLDESHQQLAMMMHEVLDGVGLKNVFTDINMNGFKITNIYTDLDDPDSVATVGSLGTYRADALAAAAAAEVSRTNAQTAATSAASAASAAAESAVAAAEAAAEAAALAHGLVVMWSGMVDTIPVGWALCDGTQGTPDLRNVFILGAGDVAPGTCGGTDTHGHTVTVNATTAVNNAATLSVAQLASHAHGITPGKPSSGSTETYRDGGDRGTLTQYSANSGSNQAHNHTQKAHAHAASANAVSNMPPYYALCFIMKL